MGLLRQDEMPLGIEPKEAYKFIKSWYSSNISLLRRKLGESDYARKSEELVRALPPASKISKVEILAICLEVTRGYLEWAFHETDGNYKMAAYACATIETAGFPGFFTDEDRKILMKSDLAPFLMGIS